MKTTTQIAKHLRDVYFGGNWTVSCLQSHLEDVSWQEATTTIYGLNTIAALVYHIGYYVAIQLDVLSGKPLKGSDAESFTHPPIQSATDWEQLLETTWANVKALAQVIEQLPDSCLDESFVKPDYGTYFRNLQGMIEHTHYHLGQIVLIKKLLRQQAT